MRAGTRGRSSRWLGAGVGVGLLFACGVPLRRTEPGQASAAHMRAELSAGLDLYAAGESQPAALRFRGAAEQADALGAEELQRRATAAECLAWLRARALPELAACGGRLEGLQLRARHPQPGFAALAALGAVAAGEPLAAPRAPDPAPGVPQSCRDWRDEHRLWKIELLRRYLSGAPQASLDAAVFEMLQREAYLTSCPVTVAGARAELVGWRLLSRPPDTYPGAVLDSLLEQAGLELDPRLWFEAR